MSTAKTEPYTQTLKETMRRKSEILSKAQAIVGGWYDRNSATTLAICCQL